jgi:thiol-disulfide isomerase/thioredoxin
MSYVKYKDLGEKGDTKSNGDPKSGGKAKNRENFENLPTNKDSGNDADTYVFEIKSSEDRLSAINNHKFCVIDVWGDWCHPCKMIARPYAILAKKYYRPNFCLLAKQETKVEYRSGGAEEVKGVPTFQFFKEGKYVGSVVGADIPEVEKRLNELLSN